MIKKGIGSIRLHHVGFGSDIRLGSCVLHVEHYTGESTSVIEGESFAAERMDVLYSQRPQIRLESKNGIVEERVTELTVDFSPIPHPGY